MIFAISYEYHMISELIDTETIDSIKRKYFQLPFNF